MSTPPTILEIAKYGLDTVPNDRTVTVSLRDILFVHQVLGELNRFFHQPLHYKSLQDVLDFLSGDGGGFDALHSAYYETSRRLIPADLDDKFADGIFEHPEPPAYYRVRE
jgi:hypothetical protein